MKRLSVVPRRQASAIAVAVALLLGQYTPAHAQEAKTFDVAAQDTAAALRQAAVQGGVEIMIPPKLVAGKTSQELKGRHEPGAALRKLLEGTGLTVRQVNSRAFVVEERAAGAPGSQPASAAVGGNGADPTVPAQAQDAARASEAARADGGVPVNASAAMSMAGLPKVEVTGSRLARIDTEGPIPVNVYRKEDIQRSGQPTLERFLNSLNEASTKGEGTQTGTFGAGVVQMRGLPLGSTVVLINGRRVEAVGSSGANYFDLNLIPMAAIERVEILPVGSSAVYGGDALAGVVNVILKKSMDGVSLDARVGSGKGLGDASVSLATGKQGEDGSFLLLGSFNKATPLSMKDRSFFQDMDYRRFGGTDFRAQRFCSPGTVSSTNGANLPGLTSNFAAIPSASAGQKLTVSDFVATAGQSNVCGLVSNGNGYGLIHATQDIALHAVGDYRLSGSWSLFGELTYTQDRVRTDENALALNSVTVPASNAFNPFGVPVTVARRLGADNGLTGYERDTDYTRAVIGLRGNLSARWELEASLTTSVDKSGVQVYNNGDVNTSARAAALASSDPATALNPFTTGKAASDAVLRAIWTTATQDNNGQKNLASAFARGPLADLPAGSLDALVGTEYATELYKSHVVGVGGTTSFDVTRQTSAVYGELRAPLLRGGGVADKGWEMAALTLAGRRDRYSDFGSASTYQAGIELRPQKTLLVRAAEATSFKPPTLLQTHVPSESAGSTEDNGLVDPKRGGAPIVGGEVLIATNPDLKPENGRAYTWGATWEPAAGSRLGFTAWRVRINGLIASISPQTVLNNEALFPTWVTRAPSANGAPGVVTRVLALYANIGSVDTAGVDLEATHSWKTDAGKWNLGFSATRTSRYDVVLAPGVATQSRLNIRDRDFWAPQWKGRLSEGFATDIWNIGLTSRYLGAYKDSSAATARSLGNYFVHDLAGSIDLKKLGAFADAKASALTVSINNLSNRQPEYITAFPFYDFSQGDWRGRYLTARLSVDW